MLQTKLLPTKDAANKDGTKDTKQTIVVIRIIVIVIVQLIVVVFSSSSSRSSRSSSSSICFCFWATHTRKQNKNWSMRQFMQKNKKRLLLHTCTTQMKVL